MGEIIQEAYKILNAPNPKEKQIKKITKIAKYNFKWSRKQIFNYILKWFPEIENDFNAHAFNNYNLTKLYAAMDKYQLSNIIQRLEAIERRNRSKK